jgi:hypothetical protein
MQHYTATPKPRLSRVRGALNGLDARAGLTFRRPLRAGRDGLRPTLRRATLDTNSQTKAPHARLVGTACAPRSAGRPSMPPLRKRRTHDSVGLACAPRSVGRPSMPPLRRRRRADDGSGWPPPHAPPGHPRCLSDKGAARTTGRDGLRPRSAGHPRCNVSDEGAARTTGTQKTSAASCSPGACRCAAEERQHRADLNARIRHVPGSMQAPLVETHPSRSV